MSKSNDLKNDPQVRALLRQAWQDGLNSADYDFESSRVYSTEVNPFDDDPDRHYTIDAQLAVTVKADGSVVLDFDLAEAGWRVIASGDVDDTGTVSAACAKIGNRHSITIPA